MKLPTPFIRLPVQFDAERLAHELSQFSENDWTNHPLNYKGNSALRLISMDGEENDAVAGEMMPTTHLRKCEYVQQVLSSFKSVLSRSRFMRLGPGEIVPPHCDINYHWTNRTRIHIPIITHPDVQFVCDDQSVNMAEGQAWIFDNWRRHCVKNNSNITRIHLVVDTAGSPYFWNLVRQGQTKNFENTTPEGLRLAYQAGVQASFMTERFSSHTVMPASEVNTRCDDILSDLGTDATDVGKSTQNILIHLLINFKHDWESLWRVYGDDWNNVKYFREYITKLRIRLESVPNIVTLQSNGQSALQIINLHLLNPSVASKFLVNANTPKLKVQGKIRDFFDRPVFIVAAPRSGSTLLFETLTCASQLYSIGGESHSIFESLDALNPIHPAGCESNRLTEEHATPNISEAIRRGFASLLKDREGNFVEIGDVNRIRLLDKLPKNSLRIPFLRAVFPDALFIYLYRNPWHSISSMIEAWDSGQWVTYPSIMVEGKPWSLLLPPNWQELCKQSIASICASQWVAANEFITSDISTIGIDRCLTINYDDLTKNTYKTTQAICDFLNIKMDRYLHERVSSPLPVSRYTQTLPYAKKWERNSPAITATEPLFLKTWEKIQFLSQIK